MSAGLSYKDNTEYNLLVSQGLVQGVAAVTQIGRAPDGVQTTVSDIWSRCDSVPTQQIWIPPTTARIHNITSTSPNDNTGGTGAVSVIVYGLTSWSSEEVSEVVTLNGVTSVPTVNSYVIIHRMTAVAQSTTTSVGINAGVIRATAVTDATITAQIDANAGTTQMAIYGVPSTKMLYVKTFFAYMNDSAGATRADIQFRINFNPNVQRFGFVNGGNIQIQNQGSSGIINELSITNSIPGPAIVKIQAIANTADVDVTAGFTAYLIDN
jgi:hypothetical protein